MDDDIFHNNKIEKMMFYFQQDLDQNLALITSYRNWINDNGDIIENHPAINRFHSEDTLLSRIDLGNHMLISGQNSRCTYTSFSLFKYTYTRAKYTIVYHKGGAIPPYYV